MPHPRDVRFIFSTADINFDVVSLEITEGLCELYCLTVNLVSTSAIADFAQLLDQHAALSLWQGEQPVRHVHELISRFEQDKTGFHRTAYRAVIEPQLARATSSDTVNRPASWSIKTPTTNATTTPAVTSTMTLARSARRCTQRRQCAPGAGTGVLSGRPLC